MQTHVDVYVKYCMSIAREFQARLSRMEVFVKHNLTSGGAREGILRDLLARHTPKDFEVGQGFICDPTREGMVSKQCDILVYNQSHFPVVYEDGQIKVVWPDSAKMVIEVKTQLGKKEIKAALENIEAARKVSITAEGVIFAFNSGNLRTVKNHLETFLPSISDNHSPEALLLFDKGIIIHRTSTPKAYSVRRAKKGKDKGAVVTAYLLLRFLNAVWKMSRGTHGADVYTMLDEMLKVHTVKMEAIDCVNSGDGG